MIKHYKKKKNLKLAAVDNVPFGPFLLSNKYVIGTTNSQQVSVFIKSVLVNLVVASSSMRCRPEKNNHNQLDSFQLCGLKCFKVFIFLRERVL